MSVSSRRWGVRGRRGVLAGEKQAFTAGPLPDAPRRGHARPEVEGAPEPPVPVLAALVSVGKAVTRWAFLSPSC